MTREEAIVLLEELKRQMRSGSAPPLDQEALARRYVEIIKSSETDRLPGQHPCPASPPGRFVENRPARAAVGSAPVRRHIPGMTDKARKQPTDKGSAIARWEDEGGASKRKRPRGASSTSASPGNGKPACVDADRKAWTIRYALGVLTCALAVALASPSAAAPAEEAFAARFTGTWSGGGAVMADGMARPQRVTCRLAGVGGPAALRIAGTCRLGIFFSRSIAASVAYDPASRRYGGTYEGARAGIARLSGRRQGDALHLAVVWPRPVHGDPRAEMTIVNQGDGSLRIVVEHPFAPAAASGGRVGSADLVLSRH